MDKAQQAVSGSPPVYQLVENRSTPGGFWTAITSGRKGGFCDWASSGVDRTYTGERHTNAGVNWPTEVQRACRVPYRGRAPADRPVEGTIVVLYFCTPMSAQFLSYLSASFRTCQRGVFWFWFFLEFCKFGSSGDEPPPAPLF